MESQPQNPEFRNNPEKFHPFTLKGGDMKEDVNNQNLRLKKNDGCEFCSIP